MGLNLIFRIEVLFFGGKKDKDLNVVPLENYNYKSASEGVLTTADGVAAWQYIYTHYGVRKSYDAFYHDFLQIGGS